MEAVVDSTHEERLITRLNELLVWTTRTPEGCLNWVGSTSKGYAIGRVFGKKWRIHRFVVYCSLSEEDRIEFLESKMEVLHTCDNPTCVDIKHLRLGTHIDNMYDMLSKGREAHNKGEDNGSAVLTEEQVLEIRRLYSQGLYSHRGLAELFDVSSFAIYACINNRTWAHI